MYAIFYVGYCWLKNSQSLVSSILKTLEAASQFQQKVMEQDLWYTLPICFLGPNKSPSAMPVCQQADFLGGPEHPQRTKPGARWQTFLSVNGVEMATVKRFCLCLKKKFLLELKQQTSIPTGDHGASVLVMFKVLYICLWDAFEHVSVFFQVDYFST